MPRQRSAARAWLVALRARLLAVGAVLAALMTVALAAIPGPARASLARCRGQSLLPNGINGSLVERATICLLNRMRAEHGLWPLRANRALRGIALGHSLDMVERDYFADDSASGQTPFVDVMDSPYRAGATHLTAGQNIGWGTLGDATPLQMVRGWMASPPHRKIILTGAYRNIGVGIVAAVPSVKSEGAAGATYTIELAARWF